MRSSPVVLASSLLSIAHIATASWAGNWGVWKAPDWTAPNSGACMTATDAQGVADNFQALIANYSDALAEKVLTENFHDYTDSVIELIDSGCPSGPVTRGTPAFASRTEFEKAQSAQPAIDFQQLNLWHNCETVTLRWMSRMTPTNITGIIVLETTKADNNAPWLINTVYSEFNSGAWLVDLGVFKPQNCSAATATSTASTAPTGTAAPAQAVSGSSEAAPARRGLVL